MTAFDAIHPRAERFSLISRDRFQLLYREALDAPAGDFLEVGVYSGGSAYFLAHLVKPGHRLYACDTFAGLPDQKGKQDAHAVGWFAASRAEVEPLLVGLPVVLVEGVFPASASHLLGSWNEPFTFAHVDVDYYQSVLDCCETIWPRLAPGGVIVFDDYGFDGCRGAKQAVDEFFKGVAPVERPPTRQAVVRKPR